MLCTGQQLLKWIYNDWEVRIMEFRIDECIPDVVSMMALAQAIANFDLNGKKPQDVNLGRMANV